MKIGDKVRFLSEVGGGRVSGFQGKDIVLVEDEDGFEIPTSVHDVVVVEQDDYAMGKMISAKMEASAESRGACCHRTASGQQKHQVDSQRP